MWSKAKGRRLLPQGSSPLDRRLPSRTSENGPCIFALSLTREIKTQQTSCRDIIVTQDFSERISLLEFMKIEKTH